MTKPEAQAALAKYGSTRAMARALHVGRHTISAWLKGASTVGKSKPVSLDHAPIGNRKTLADFRQTYDKATIVPNKVRAALKLLGASGWEYEVPFARSAGVSLSDLSNFREMFADYIVTLNRENKRAWAGSPATAKQMREML